MFSVGQGNTVQQIKIAYKEHEFLGCISQRERLPHAHSSSLVTRVGTTHKERLVRISSVLFASWVKLNMLHNGVK